MSFTLTWLARIVCLCVCSDQASSSAKTRALILDENENENEDDKNEQNEEHMLRITFQRPNLGHTNRCLRVFCMYVCVATFMILSRWFARASKEVEICPRLSGALFRFVLFTFTLFSYDFVIYSCSTQGPIDKIGANNWNI